MKIILVTYQTTYTESPNLGGFSHKTKKTLIKKKKVLPEVSKPVTTHNAH